MDSLCALSHAGHDSDYGGREPPPPPITYLKHVYTVGINQLPPPHHCPLREGQRPNNAADSRGGGTGRCRNVVTGDGQKLETVESLKYLGHILIETDDEKNYYLII